MEFLYKKSDEDIKIEKATFWVAFLAFLIDNRFRIYILS